MSATILNQPTTLLAPQRAARLATKLNADDPDWRYRAVQPEGSRYAYIEVREKDGTLLGKL